MGFCGIEAFFHILQKGFEIMREMELIAINAKYIHSNLAVYCLQAYAKKMGLKVGIHEYTINHNADHILQDIYLMKPKMVGFSCYIWNIDYVYELTYELSRLLPETEIWLGGPEVSFEMETILENHPEIKGILVGEGEETLADLLKELPLSSISGIAYREDGKIVVNSARHCMNLDDLPFPYPDLKEQNHRILYYESSRGCPFSCSYCLSSVDRQLRFKSLPKVYEELQLFLDEMVEQVKFVDRTYNAKVEHARNIWNYIKEHDNGITNFHFEIAADILKEEEIELLQSMRPGLVQLEIGVQSTNLKTIKEINRVMEVKRVAEVTEALKKNGNINLHLDLIAGLPYEDLNTFKQSFNDLHDMAPHQLQLGFLKVLTGSYMYEHAKDYELIYHKRAPYEVLKTKWLSFEDVIALKQVEDMVETYYNSGQFTTTLAVCFASLNMSPYDFYEGLGHFYEKNGYQSATPNRIRRYELLLEYATKELGLNQELISQSLLFDLYLRENLKSRPDFAPKLSDEAYVINKNTGKTKHTEEFAYDFMSLDFYGKKGSFSKKKTLCQFDYEKKDVVTRNVKVAKVELGNL